MKKSSIKLRSKISSDIKVYGYWGSKSKIGTVFHYKQLIAGIFIFLVCIVFPVLSRANITVTPANTSICTNYAASGSAPQWTTLGTITVTEGANSDMGNTAGGWTITLVLAAPAGWQFNTGVSPTLGFTTGANISSVTQGAFSSTSLTIIISGTQKNKSDAMTISGLQVQPTTTSAIAGNIKPSSITGTMTGVTNSTNFGTLTPLSPSAGAADISIAASPSGVICAGTNVTFTATPVNGGSAPSYQWKLNGSAVSGATNITYSTNTLVNGNTLACAIVSNSCIATPAATSNTITMAVLSNPDVSNFTSPSATAVCMGTGSVITVNSTSLGSGTYTVTYNLGAPNTASGLTATLSMGTSAGTFSTAPLANSGSTSITITSIQNISGCSTSVLSGNTTTITVNPLPTTINGTLTVCQGATTTLTDATAGGTWSSSNGNASVGSTGIVTGNSGGATATITYTLPTGCIITTTVTVNPLPGIINGTLTVCQGLTTTLTDATAGGTWSSSNGNASVGTTGIVTGNTGGTTATITYTLGTGCIMTAIVTVNPLPGAINGAKSVCAGLTTTLTDATAGGTWSSSNGNASVGTTGIVTGNTGGTTATITYTLPTGCITTALVTVNPLPTTINGTLTVCQGATTPLTDATAGGTWSSSNGNASVGTTGIVTGNTAGNTATITYTLGTGCIITAVVTVNSLPAVISGTLVVCQGATTTLTDATAGGTWSSSNGNASVGTTGSVTGNTAGTTIITYSVTGIGCIATAIVSVHALPTVATISASPNPVEIDSPLTLTAGAVTGTGSLISYNWTGPISYSATTATNSAIYTPTTTAASGNYSVTVTYPGIGCTSAAAVIDVTAYGVVPGCGLDVPYYYVDLTGSPGGSWISPSHTRNGNCCGSSHPDVCTSFDVTLDPNAAMVNFSISSGARPSGSLYYQIECGTPIPVGQPICIIGAGPHHITFCKPGGNANTYTISSISAPVFPKNDSIQVECNKSFTILGLASGSITWNSIYPGATGTYNSYMTLTDSTHFLYSASAGAPPYIDYKICGHPLSATCGYVDLCDTLRIYNIGINGVPAVCPGATMSLTDAIAGGTWSSSNSNATVGSTGIVTGVTSGTATISYSVPTGCITTVVVTINPLPGTINGTKSVCAGLTTALTDANAGGTWSSSNGNASVGTTGIVTGNTGGTTATITYTLPTGCVATTAVTINPLPSPINGTSVVCRGLTTALTDATAGGTWSSSNGNASVGTTGIVTGNTGGTTATITYTLPTGCITTTAVTVNPLPAAINGISKICQGLTTALTDASLGGTWSSSNGNASVGTTGIVTGNTGGTTATITYTLPTGCIATTAVTINPLPAPINGTSAVCSGLTTALTDATAGGTWSSSNSNASVGTTGIVTGNTGSTTATITYSLPTSCITTTVVTVNSLPSAINGIPVVCQGATTILTDVTTGGGWSSSNGNASIGTTGIVTGNTAGTTSITYTLPAGCIATVIVTINPLPVAGAITGTAIVCAGGTTPLSNTTSGGVWSSGATSIATVSSTGVVTGISLGTATISYTATNTCGSAIATDIVTVNSTSNVGPVTGIPSTCIGLTTILADTTIDGAWSSSTTSVATISSTGVVTGVSAGTATISYIANTTCGSAIATMIVTVANSPTPITGNLNVCVGGTTSLSDAATGGRWSSSNSYVATVGSATGIVTGASFGIATITYSMGPGCITTATIFSSFAAAITGTTSICMGGTTALSDTSFIGTWSSSNMGIAIVSLHTGNVTGITPGTANITYTPETGCTTITAITVNPTSVINGINTACIGATTTLTDATGGGTWSSSNTSIAAIGSLTGIVTGIGAGTATVTYALSSGCKSTRTVNINELPSNVIVGGSGNYCLYTTITATNGGDGIIYFEDTVSGGTSTYQPETSAIITSSGTYYFRAQSPDGCWGNEGSVTVVINPLPASIMGTTTICAGSTTTLTDAIAGGIWSSSNTAKATIGSASGIMTGIAAGTANITYTTPGGCIATTIIYVNPTSNINGVSMICEGATTILTDAATGGVWSSNNIAVATIGSTTGIVSGIAMGSTTITYTLATGCTAMKTLTVNPLPSAITGTAHVCVGQTTALTDATGSGIWSSCNRTIASVDSITGVATGMGSGTATITYLLPTGCKSTYVVTVNPLLPPISGTANVCIGSTTSLTDIAASGIWTSSDSTLATVNAIGIVTGIAAGMPVMTYTPATGCYRTIMVTVNPVSTILGNSPVCTNSTVNMTGGIPGGTWSTSDVITIAIGSSTGIVTGLATGSGTVTYILPTGCKSTAIVTVNPLPTAISGTASLCIGTTTALSDFITGGTWRSNDSTLATIDATGIVTGIAAGMPVITYTLITGCFKTVIATVNPISAITGAGNVCTGATINLNDANAGGLWNSGATGIATVNTSTGVVTGIAPGTTSITYSLPTGCRSVTVITVNPLPPAITGAGNVCTGSILALSDATAGGTWSSSNYAVASVGSAGIVYGAGAGIATITYTLGTGCSTTALVTVDPLPSTITGTTTVCAGSTTSLNNVTPGGIWSSSNASIATVCAATGTVTGVSGGTAIITYTMAPGCYATTFVTINPILPITGILSACTGLTTSLNDATPGGTWSSSNPSIGSIDAVSGIVTGIINGSVTISYTIPGCVRTATVAINPAPAPISGPATVCAGYTTTLSDVVPGGTWSSSPAYFATVDNTGVVSGLFAGTVTIIYTEGAGCTATTVLTVYPNFSGITGAASECLGTNITLSNATTGGTWSSSNTSNVTIDATGTAYGTGVGTSTITYMLANGCFVTYPNTVIPNPSAIVGTTTLCTNATIPLTDTTSGAISWTSSNTSVATVINSGTVTGIAAGTATITYKVLSGCITTTTVTVNALPPAILGNVPVCAGSAITLTDIAGSGAWTSCNTSVAVAGSATGIVTGVAGGTATIRYTATGGCSITTIVTVNPMLPISGAGFVCQGSSITLSDATASGIWSSNNTSVATIGATGIVTGVIPGTATISYTITGTSCSATAIVTVGVQPAAITGIATVCNNYTTLLSDATPGGIWSSNNGLVATVGSTSGIVTASITYVTGTATITYSAGGCAATRVVTVNLTPLPVQGPSYQCLGTTISLSDAVPGGTWSSSNPSISTIDASGNVTGISVGTNTVSYTLGTGCYVAYPNTVRPNPSAILGTYTVCAASATQLSDTTSGAISWTSSNTLVASVINSGTVTGIAGGTATITYKILSGCIATQVVTVSPQPAAIIGAGHICQGYSVTLSDATTGGTWSSADTSVAIINSSGVATGISSGTDVIIYTAGAGCTNTTTIIVYATPAISGNTPICYGGAIILSDAIAGGTWSSNDITICTVDPVAGIVTAVSTGTATVTYLMNTGCFATTVITVNPAIANVTIAGSPVICSGTTTTLADATPGGSWISGDVSIGSVDPSLGIVTGISAGIVNITYTIGTGCVASNVVTVVAAPATLSGVNITCSGSTTSFSDATPDGTWSSSNVSVAYTSTITGLVTGISEGTANISYILPNGCFNKTTVTVDPLVSIISGTISICAGSTDSLTDVSPGGTWISSDNAIATVSSTGAITGINGGSVTITYTLNTGCYNAFSIVVNPYAGAITGPSSVDIDSVITLADIAGGGSWSCSNGNAIVDGSGNVTGINGGTTTISYSVSNICGSAVATKILTVNTGTNTVIVNGGGTYCGSATLTASNGSDGTIYFEGTDPVGTSTLTPSVSQVVSSSGTYYFRARSATGTWGGAGGATVTINPLPSAITGIAAICVGLNTSLADVTTGGTWSSSNVDIASVGSGTGIVTGTTTGTVNISYILPTGCAAGSIVTVNRLPSVITGIPGVCAGSTTSLTDATPDGIWSSSDVTKATISSTGIVTGIAVGTVNMTYTLPTGCIATKAITINPLPSAITGTSGVCIGLTTSLTDATPSGTWRSSDVTKAAVGPTGITTGVAAGTANITYTLPTGCAVINTVTVNSLPSNITGTPVVCIGSTTSLTSATYGGIWSSGATGIATIGTTSGIASGVSAGIATITYTMPTGCTGTSTLTVNALPATVIVSGGGAFCNSTTITASNGGDGTIYFQGVIAGGTSTATPSTSQVVSSSGTYYFRARSSSGCWGAEGSAVVTINPLPPAIMGSSSVCIASTSSLTDATSGGSWSSSDNTKATVSTTGIVTGITAGTANITYTLPTGCATAKTVTINSLPSPITGATATCVGSTSSFTNSTTGGIWSSGASGIATIGSSSGIATGVSAGTVNITYTISAGCIATAMLTVSTLPAMVTANGSGTFCGSTTITAENGGDGTIYFQGTTSGGTSTSMPSASQVVASSGTYYFRALSSSGCWGAEGSATVAINPLPSAITGTPGVCMGYTTNLTDATPGGAWSSSDVTVATVSTTGIVTGIIAGTANITYALPTGCKATSTITVSSLPAVISGTASICLGTTTTLSDITSGGTWTSGNTFVATVGTASGIVSGRVSGNANITYTLATGCIAVTNITVDPLPSAIMGSTNICFGSTNRLSDGTTGGSWTSSTAGVATIDADGDITIISAGTSNITYTLPTGCIATATLTINPISPILYPGNVCEGHMITLSDATTGGSWSSTPTSIATVSTGGVVTGISAGTALITYTMPSGCTATSVVTVNPQPSTITGNSALCVGFIVALSDAGGGVWSSGNTSVATIGSSSAVVLGVSAGTATITYILATGCISTTIVTIDQAPTAINGITTMCAGSSSTLTDAVTGGTWSSNNTSVATVGITSGITTGITAGTAMITYAMAAGCYATAIITVNGILPISGTMSACIGSTTSLSDGSPGGTWTSSNPSVGSIGATSGIVTGISAGTVTVSYTIPSGCVRTVTVAINPLPSPISGASAVCINATIVLSDVITGGTWSSSSPYIASVGAATGIVTGNVTGTVMITYTPGAACKVTKVVTVNINPLPVQGVTSECIGTSALLTDGSAGGTWSSSNTSTATIDASGNVTGIAMGTSIISYILGTGCYTTYPNAVLPNPAAITGPAIVCAGSSIQLTDTTSGAISWTSSNIAVASVINSGTVTGITAGTAIITYKVLSGCVAQKTITVNTQPATISGNMPLCTGTAITLTNTPGSGTWSSNNILVAAIGSSSGILTGIGAGTSTISYTISNGCSAIAIVTVNPTLPISGNTNACIGTTTTLSDAATGGIWSSNNTGIATVGSSTGIVTGVSSGTTIISYIPATGCMATTIVSIGAISAITGIPAICNNYTTTLSDATPGGTWSSSNGIIATVSGSGIVTANNTHTTGTVTISYTVGSCVVTKVITVNPTPLPVQGASSECVGTVITLSDATPGGTWNSSNANVTIDASGTLTGMNAGTSTISYIMPTGCYITYPNTIYANPASITGTFVVCAGSVTALTDVTPGALSWTSSNTSVATAINSGTITGISAGTAIITYTILHGCIATAVITVNPSPGAGTISGTLTVAVGGHVTLTDAVSGGTWTTSNISAMIGSATGIVTGITPGNVTITYHVSNSYGCAAIATSPFVVTTTAPHPAATSNITICTGQGIAINDVIPGGAWKSSNNKIADVDANGWVTGISPGSATISYVLVSNLDTSVNTISVVVNPLPGAVITANPGTVISPGAMLVLSAAVENAGQDPSYQWFINGIPVNGATSSIFQNNSFSDNDSVTCTVTSNGSCNGSVVSKTVGISVCSSEVCGNIVAASNVNIFPNPNKGTFTIKGNLGIAIDEEISIEITDLPGQVIYKNKLLAHNGMINEQIAMSNLLDNGMYILHMFSKTGNKTILFFIEK